VQGSLKTESFSHCAVLTCTAECYSCSEQTRGSYPFISYAPLLKFQNPPASSLPYKLLLYFNNKIISIFVYSFKQMQYQILYWTRPTSVAK